MTKIALPPPMTAPAPAPAPFGGGKLEASGIYLLHEEVTDAACANLIRYIFEANLDEGRKFEHIQLVINSPGGSLQSAFGVCDVIQGSMIPVHTIGIGLIASAALMIFMTGRRGERVITPNTGIL